MTELLLRKSYITALTQALMACLICAPSALWLWVYISGRPLVPVLQLLMVCGKIKIYHRCYKSFVTQLATGCDTVM